MNIFVKIRPEHPNDFKLIKEKLFELPCTVHFVIQKGIDEEFIIADYQAEPDEEADITICNKLCELSGCYTSAQIWTPETNEVVCWKNKKCKFKSCGLQVSIIEIEGERKSVPNHEIKPMIE